MRKAFLLFAFTCLCLVSCDSDTDELGKFVYLTNDEILHSTNDCPELHSTKNSIGKTPVKFKSFIDTADVIYPYHYCKNCFSDSQYQHINKLIKRNRKQKGLDTPDYIERLRQAAEASGYIVPDKATFRKDMRDEGNRQRVYYKLVNDYYFKNEFNDITFPEDFDREVTLDLLYL